MTDAKEYPISSGAKEIFDAYKMGLSHTTAHGPWKSQKTHAKLNIDLITHHFPNMTKEEQERAGRTIRNLQAQFGLTGSPIKNKHVVMALIRKSK